MLIGQIDNKLWGVAIAIDHKIMFNHKFLFIPSKRDHQYIKMNHKIVNKKVESQIGKCTNNISNLHINLQHNKYRTNLYHNKYLTNLQHNKYTQIIAIIIILIRRTKQLILREKKGENTKNNQICKLVKGNKINRNLNLNRVKDHNNNNSKVKQIFFQNSVNLNHNKDGDNNNNNNKLMIQQPYKDKNIEKNWISKFRRRKTEKCKMQPGGLQVILPMLMIIKNLTIKINLLHFLHIQLNHHPITIMEALLPNQHQQMIQQKGDFYKEDLQVDKQMIHRNKRRKNNMPRN